MCLLLLQHCSRIGLIGFMLCRAVKCSLVSCSMCPFLSLLCSILLALHHMKHFIWFAGYSARQHSGFFLDADGSKLCFR